jgi:hypothetical protein
MVMDRISAPPQNALLGRLADLLRLAETGASGGPEFLPKGLDVMNLVRQLALPSAETVEKLSYGDPLFRMAPSGTGSRIPMTTDREYLADVAGMVPIAAPAAKPSARGVQDLVREIQTTPPTGSVKLADDAAQGLLDTSYRGSHSAPSRDFGAQLHQLNQIFPDDIYSPQAARLYGHFGGGDPMDRQTIMIAQSLRGKPDADVTIYRAVPKDPSIKEINPGDWVTINPSYAKDHGESVLRGEYKIIKKKVKAKDIWTNADSIHEYGYDPS